MESRAESQEALSPPHRRKLSSTIYNNNNNNNSITSNHSDYSNNYNMEGEDNDEDSGLSMNSNSKNGIQNHKKNFKSLTHANVSRTDSNNKNNGHHHYHKNNNVSDKIHLSTPATNTNSNANANTNKPSEITNQSHLTDSDRELQLHSRASQEDGSNLNDSSSFSSSSTLALSSPFSQSSSQSSSSSSPLPPPKGESARLKSNSSSSEQKDKNFFSSDLNSAHLSSQSSNSSSSSNSKNNSSAPRLTFSPETSRTKTTSTTSANAHVDFSSPSSSSHFRPSSTSSPTDLFGELNKIKSTPGNSQSTHSQYNNSSGSSRSTNGVSSVSASRQPGNCDFNVESPNGLSTLDSRAISENTNGAGNMSSILSENSIVNHSHSSSNISSNEENFECVAEGTESFLDSHSEQNSLQYSRDVNDLSSLPVPGDNLPIRRNSWLRTSLRKSPQGSSNEMGHRRWGSFRNPTGSKRPAIASSTASALANQLYRSSSFHSSGRSSAGDGEEMYSDGSLEDDVNDLTQKVNHLEEKFSVLAEQHTDVDDRYNRVRQENAELSTKLFMSEELLRDLELRSEEKLKDEQRRFKDTLTRVEREKQLQIENYDIRLRSCEKELEQAKSEVSRIKQKLDRERSEKLTLSDKLSETERELSTSKEDYRAHLDVLRKERDAYSLEATSSQQAYMEMKKEFDSVRKRSMLDSSSDFRLSGGHSLRLSSVDSESEAAELKSRLHESEEENKMLKKQLRQLQETNDELSAQILNHGLEEGRHLLTVNNRTMEDMSNSLAAEFEFMSQDQLKKALKEQQDVNDQLRNYIDGILLNIVENYPQLLEVKNKSADVSMEQTS